MGLYLAVPLALLVALLQVALISDVLVFGISPNFVLLFAVSWVLLRGIREGLLIGLVAGIVMDVNSGAAFGITILALVSAVFFAGVGEINVFRGAWFLKYLVIAGASLLYSSLSILLLRLMGHRLLFWPVLGRVVLPEILLSVAFMPLVYGLTKWLSLQLQPETVEF